MKHTLPAAALLGSLIVAAAASAAETDLGRLVERLAPAKPAPEGSVRVVGWIEQVATHLELVLTLEPKGAAKLVADPGISVAPRPEPGIEWLGHAPVELTDPTRGYFEAVPTIRLPFRLSGARPSGGVGEIAATVEYAWCLVDYQCLFGEATVSLPAPGAS